LQDEKGVKLEKDERSKVVEDCERQEELSVHLDSNNDSNLLEISS
jgi:hypothetical protein